MAAEQFDISTLQRSVAQAGHTWLVREAMFSDQEFQNRLGVLTEPSPTQAAAVAWTQQAMGGAGLQVRQDWTHLIDVTASTRRAGYGRRTGTGATRR